MRRAAARLMMSCLVSAVALVGCKKKDETQNTQYPPPGQQQPPPGQYYPQQPPPATAAPPATTAPPAATGGQPTASGGLPCQADATCMTHRCNLAAGKCAWPCQSNDDCQPGNQCMPGIGTCAPPIPGMTPPAQ